ncbi:hypothetical protein M427DRAFT_61280 [Gonapodya prolifera JEL478]|uniref:AMP-activated protein kinase glycogen-binding domain-containing protein n=1 Tax=Gonapodya prolifera (strain JEL478) TaxID=1344416 RepID=A0A139A3F4_GONPJ|nr:hypothetical protein M427DRAFT_61280 [Gonapodya prolifera JEL478]|eukprot:KXS10913.1 hypothetical protein M427DRAFT_61280 [Gonapodya prolifera JEL478]
MEKRTVEGKAPVFLARVELPAGSRVEFKYVADGQWLTDDSMPISTDGAGNKNNYIVTPAHPGEALDPTFLAHDHLAKLVGESSSPSVPASAATPSLVTTVVEPSPVATEAPVVPAKVESAPKVEDDSSSTALLLANDSLPPSYGSVVPNGSGANGVANGHPAPAPAPKKTDDEKILAVPAADVATVKPSEPDHKPVPTTVVNGGVGSPVLSSLPPLPDIDVKKDGMVETGKSTEPSKAKSSDNDAEASRTPVKNKPVLPTPNATAPAEEKQPVAVPLPVATPTSTPKTAPTALSAEVQSRRASPVILAKGEPKTLPEPSSKPASGSGGAVSKRGPKGFRFPWLMFLGAAAVVGLGFVVAGWLGKKN